MLRPRPAPFGRVSSRLPPRRTSRIHGDGRLGVLASWAANLLGEGGTPPPHEVMDFFAHHLGLVEPTPHILILGQPDATTLAPSVRDRVSQFFARQPYNYYGAAVVERGGLTIAVVLLSTRALDLNPVPRHLGAGQALALRGTLAQGLSHPVLVVAPPSGQVQRTEAGNGPAFHLDVPTTQTGVYKVELVADGTHGDTVVANFPVYVGVDVPSTVTVEDAGGGARGDARSVRDKLLEAHERHAA